MENDDDRTLEEMARWLLDLEQKKPNNDENNSN